MEAKLPAARNNIVHSQFQIYGISVEKSLRQICRAKSQKVNFTGEAET